MLFGSMTKNGALQIGQFLVSGVNGNDCQWDTMETEVRCSAYEYAMCRVVEVSLLNGYYVMKVKYRRVFSE